MRHQFALRKLGRTSEHRLAMHRNLVQSLFEHGQIRTTLQKAKDLRPIAERLITMAKQARQGDLGARRRIHSMMGERYLISKENQDNYDNMSNAERRTVMKFRSGRHHRTGEAKGALPFTAEAVSHRLIDKIAARYEDRRGGYTRIVRLSKARLGDNGEQAILQLVGEEQKPGNVPKAGKSSRKRRTDARYSVFLTATKKKSQPAARTSVNDTEKTETSGDQTAE